MMRLLIDEDTAVQVIEPLRHVLLGHEVAHISGLSWKGKKDLVGVTSQRTRRRLHPGGTADAARLAVGEGADGGGDHVGGAVDGRGDRAGRVAHRRGHLTLAIATVSALVPVFAATGI